MRLYVELALHLKELGVAEELPVPPLRCLPQTHSQAASGCGAGKNPEAPD